MRATALTLVSILLVAGCLTQGHCQSPSDQDERLKEFLQSYVGSPTEETKTTQYDAAFVDLRDDGRNEVIVYLWSAYWCGTAGCTTLILAPEGTSYRIVSENVAIRLPISVLTTKTNGWHDISVVARKNGTEPLYEEMLSFNGKAYRISSAVLSARRLNGKVTERIVMPETADDKALYP